MLNEYSENGTTLGTSGEDVWNTLVSSVVFSLAKLSPPSESDFETVVLELFNEALHPSGSFVSKVASSPLVSSVFFSSSPLVWSVFL